MATMTELKRLVVGGRDKRSGPAPLFVVNIDGVPWATNSYWMVRADRLKVLFDHFNLPTTDEASYEVNGTVRASGKDAPTSAMRTFLKTPYEVELERTTVDGIGEVYAKGGADVLLAAYDRPDGERVFFNDAFLSWILGAVDESLGYGARWDTGSLQIRQTQGSGLKAAAFYAAREVQHGGNNGLDGKWIPATWEKGPEEMFAILMPVRR